MATAALPTLAPGSYLTDGKGLFFVMRVNRHGVLLENAHTLERDLMAPEKLVGWRTVVPRD